MYLCYIDESGTANIPGNTSHYILAGLAIPIWFWQNCEKDISLIKRRYELGNSEIHTGWILRSYSEQNKVSNFESLNYVQRRCEVEKLRKIEIFQLQKSQNKKLYQQTRKNFHRTNPYVHLTYKQRIALIDDLAQVISNWGFARLFAECVDKVHFNPSKTIQPLDEQAFEQLVSRFEHFLKSTEIQQEGNRFGMLIHDNNETVAKRHTQLMKAFHQQGTFWTEIEHIIETPLFVSSELTSMIQIADLCAYILRRYLENGEEDLFNKVFKRADRKGNVAVGVRHFTGSSCACHICTAHRPLSQMIVEIK